MIARHCRMNSTSKSSIRCLVNYLINDRGSSSRVQNIRITGCESEEADWAAMEMLAVQQMNTRAQNDKTYHLVLSFQEGEHPSMERINEIEDYICKALKFEEHQRVSVLHGDTENLHLHLAINKIHPKKLTIHEPYYDRRELAKACVYLEKKYGLSLDNHEFKTEARPNASANMEHAGDMESLTGWLQRNCAESLKKAESWQEVNNILAEHGITLSVRGNGFVFSSGNVHVKASSVDRSLSKSRMEKRLGAFEATKEQAKPRKQYVRRPLSASSELWNKYQQEEKQRQAENERKINEDMERRKEAIDDFRLRNLLIRNMTSGTLNRLILYKLSRAALKKDFQRKSQWIDWNMSRAARSDGQDSLEYLRTRPGKREYRGALIAGIAKGSLPTPEKVTRKGTRIYPGGVRERDGILLIPRNPSREEMENILDFAEKHLSRVAIHAPAPLRKKLVEVLTARSSARNRSREYDSEMEI